MAGSANPMVGTAATMAYWLAELSRANPELPVPVQPRRPTSRTTSQLAAGTRDVGRGCAPSWCCSPTLRAAVDQQAPKTDRSVENPRVFIPLGGPWAPLTARLRSRLCLVAKAVRRQETEPGTLVTGPNPRNDRGAMTVVESLPGFHPFGWGTGSRPRPQAKNQANSGFCPFAAHRCHSYTRDIGHGRGLRGVRALSGGNTRALRALGNCCAAGRSGRPGSISPSLTPSDGDH